MSTSVTLPALGESVTEGTVVRWLKQVGDDVALGEPLLEVSTDKVDTEIPSPTAGVLLEIIIGEEETVPVGAQLAVIGVVGSASAAPPRPAVPVEAPSAQVVQRPAARSIPEPPAVRAERNRERVATTTTTGFLSPLVRTMAADLGVDLTAIRGSGGHGRIRKQDLIAVAESRRSPAAPPAPAAPALTAPRGTTEKLSRLRKVIASRMVESLQTSAQLTQVMEVDVTRIARLRDSVKANFLAREGVKLTYLPFFAKAAIDALKQHPKLNASVDAAAGEVTYWSDWHIAFAVDTDRGLLTPVVKDAGDLSIAGLARRVADLADRTRTNTITPDELTGGTFTITNLGSFGALFDSPIINQPQVAILGPGAVVKRPVVIDNPNLGETIAVRYMAYLSLSYDHRIVDGADAGRFLSDVKKRLEAAQFEV